MKGKTEIRSAVEMGYKGNWNRFVTLARPNENWHCFPIVVGEFGIDMFLFQKRNESSICSYDGSSTYANQAQGWTSGANSIAIAACSCNRF